MACPRNGPVPSILKGMSQERACPKDFKRACPKSGHVPSILKGMSQERARPKQLKGMCQERAFPNEFKGHVPRAGLSQTFCVVGLYFTISFNFFMGVAITVFDAGFAL